jgi:hypothetical protein
VNTANLPNPDHLEQLQNITREYSRFSQTSLGYAWIPAALLLPVCWWLSRTLEPRASMIVLLLVFGVWFDVRHWLRQSLYQRFGNVIEIPQASSANFVAGVMIGAALAIPLLIVIQQFGWARIPMLENFNPNAFVILVGGFFGFSRLLKRDFSSAVVMFLLVIFSVNGRHFNEIFAYQQVAQVLCVIGIPTYLIVRGRQEHQQFQNLELQLKSFRAQP